jgi:hypothetical protein
MVAAREPIDALGLLQAHGQRNPQRYLDYYTIR